MEASTRLKVAFKEGRQTVGMWQMLPGANISRLLSRTGVDWVCVDCEHGNIDGKFGVHVPVISNGKNREEAHMMAITSRWSYARCGPGYCSHGRLADRQDPRPTTVDGEA